MARKGKSFTDNIPPLASNPAMQFISHAADAHEVTQDTAHDDANEKTHEEAQEAALGAAQEKRPGYIRTQGRKGHKKPRFNLAIDSYALLEKIHARAEIEDKSITQFINDVLYLYLKNKARK